MTKFKKIVFVLSSIIGIVIMGYYYSIDQSKTKIAIVPKTASVKAREKTKPKTIIAKNLDPKIAIGPKTASVKAREKITEGQKNLLKENRSVRPVLNSNIIKYDYDEAFFVVAIIVCAVVCAVVGAFVGAFVGWNYVRVGVMRYVGAFVGIFVGYSVGYFVGIFVGIFVATFVWIYEALKPKKVSPKESRV